MTDARTRPAHASRRARLARRWLELCASYLPCGAQDPLWRFSRAPVPEDPEQGWKLHVSATILTANETLARIGPYLRGEGVLFKAPATLDELEKINSGLFYGYSQVGKFVTVYPQSDAEARRLAERLHGLTSGLAAPAVPFDMRFGQAGNVYFRYGAFAPLEIRNPDGSATPALRDPEGNLVPDARDSPLARPAWVGAPLIAPPSDGRVAGGPLREKYRAFRALTQRGKGGVYQALDVSSRPARLCLLKEGRRHGETAWDGRDSRDRVRHELRVLGRLREAGVEVPRVLGSFESGGNFYLVTEFVEGESLHVRLRRMGRRMSVARSLACGSRLASFIARIHSAGWAWRDCNPTNIMVGKGEALRPLDFEGACPLERPDPARWGTEGFTPPAPPHGGHASPLREDLYALGAVIYLLLTGRTPDAAGNVAATRLRRKLPRGLSELLGELLSGDPARQPPAAAVAERLTAWGRALKAGPASASAREQIEAPEEV